jgi:hypothetical protein
VTTVAGFLALLALLAILLGTISVIRPVRSFKIESRRTGLFVLGGGFLALVVSGMLVPGDRGSDSQQLAAEPGRLTTTTSTSSSSTTTTTTTTTMPATSTTSLVTTTTEGQTSTTSPTTTVTTQARTQESAIASVVHQSLGDSLVETEIIEQFDGGYGVMVRMNVSDNLTMNMIAGGFEIDAGDVMIALYRDNPQLDVQWVDITGLFPLTDEFGNTEPGEVVTVHLIEEDADKVNWTTEESTLALDILPGLYEWHFIHPELREYLP